MSPHPRSIPLDPAARAVLDRVASAGIQPWHRHTVPDARRVYDERLSLLRPRPIHVANVAGITIPAPGGALPARIYQPRPSELRPVVLYLHGGGWVLGSLESHDWLCRELAVTTGAVVVALEYRLAPEHPHPAALDDATVAVGWLSEHAAAIGGDGRLLVAGDSAGGHLSAALAQVVRDRGTPQLHGQVLIYPALEPRFDTTSYETNAEGYLLTRDDMIWFWAHYLGNGPAVGYAAPGQVTDLAGLPPAFIIAAGYDPLHDEGVAYARRLAGAGVPTQLLDVPDQIHGFVALPDAIPAGRTAVRAIAAWVSALTDGPSADA